MKILGKSQFQKMDYVNWWQTFLTKAPRKDKFKDVLKLVGIVLLLPLSAAQCEHAVPACTESDQEQHAVITVSINAGGLNMHITRGSTCHRI